MRDLDWKELVIWFLFGLFFSDIIHAIKVVYLFTINTFIL